MKINLHKSARQVFLPGITLRLSLSVSSPTELSGYKLRQTRVLNEDLRNLRLELLRDLIERGFAKNDTASEKLS